MRLVGDLFYQNDTPADEMFKRYPSINCQFLVSIL